MSTFCGPGPDRESTTEAAVERYVTDAVSELAPVVDVLTTELLTIIVQPLKDVATLTRRLESRIDLAVKAGIAELQPVADALDAAIGDYAVDARTLAASVQSSVALESPVAAAGVDSQGLSPAERLPGQPEGMDLAERQPEPGQAREPDTLAGEPGTTASPAARPPQGSIDAGGVVAAGAGRSPPFDVQQDGDCCAVNVTVNVNPEQQYYTDVFGGRAPGSGPSPAPTPPRPSPTPTPSPSPESPPPRPGYERPPEAGRQDAFVWPLLRVQIIAEV